MRKCSAGTVGSLWRWFFDWNPVGRFLNFKKCSSRFLGEYFFKKDQVFQLSLFYDASYDFCFLYVITWKYFFWFYTGSTPADSVWFHEDIAQTNRNTTLTIIHANNMIASQINAFFNIFHQLSYHLLSAQDVSIWNHQYIQKHSTTVAKIPRHRFIAFLITSNNVASGCLSVCTVFISSTWQSHHRLLQLLSCA